MRIISGRFKGRRFDPPSNITARPTTDFAKESLFNLINNEMDIEGITALDLFSGTGSISYELASRDALHITAIEMSEKLDGAEVVDTIEVKAEESLNYNDLRNEASTLWRKMVGEGESTNDEMALRILKRVEMIFGRPMKISEITEDQVDLFNLVLLDMRELAAEK